MKFDRLFLGVLACFLLSGFAALLFQTAWTRQFAFVFGTSELAIATVLAAYMGGLSLGAAVAGRLAHRIRRPILVYGLLELGVGLSALVMPFAIFATTALAQVWFGRVDRPPDASGMGLGLFYLGCSFLVLLVPTAFMGATLPLLARYAVRRDDQIGGRIGVLYATNTVGAIFGTLIAGFWLLPALGLSRTIYTGVGVNFLVFLVAAGLARSVAAPARSATPAAPRFAWQRCDVILPLILLSGITSFAYEVLWTRLIGQILGSSVYAFSSMLASFLAGIAIGSAVAARHARTRVHAISGFGAAQIGIAFFSVAAFACLDFLPSLVVALQTDVMGGVRPSDVGIVIAILLPSTFAIGATFPFAVRITARGEADAGSATARVYAWNTVGAIIGAIGAGFFLIPALGFAWTLGLAAALNLLVAVGVAFLGQGVARRVLIAGMIGLVLLAFLPPRTPWRLLRFAYLTRGVLPGERIFDRVGRSSTVLVLYRKGAYYVTNNGLPEAGIRPADDSSADLTNRWLGALPTLARPDTESLLVIGLGGGLVVEDVPRSIQEIDVIELEPEVVEANRFVSARRFSDPLSDPRIRIVENDARGALLLTQRRYDAIVSQPSHPWTAGASHLYTREFFDLAREHLEPGGIFIQWVGLRFVDADLLRSLVATLADVFAHVRVYSPPPYMSLLFVASDQALPIEETAAEGISRSPETFWRMGIQVPEDLAISLELDEVSARSFAEGAAVITDDENLLQTRSPRILSTPLGGAGARGLFAPYDPLERMPTDLDPVYLIRQTLARRPSHPRLPLLGSRANSEEERLVAGALYSVKQEGVGPAIQRLEAAVARDGNLAVAQQLLVRMLRPELTSRNAIAAISRLGSLNGPAAAVVEAWQVKRNEDVRELESRLAAIGPRDPLYPDAIRLRARWRVAAGDPVLAAEAVALLNRISAGRDGNSGDFFLRSRASMRAGDVPTALRSLDVSLDRLSVKDPRAPGKLRSLASFLRAIPVTGHDAIDAARIQQKIRARLSAYPRPGAPRANP
ncbi:MAG: fused MFS/spermidine synthase [Myxococcota bacterium]